MWVGGGIASCEPEGTKRDRRRRPKLTHTSIDINSPNERDDHVRADKHTLERHGVLDVGVRLGARQRRVRVAVRVLYMFVVGGCCA